MITKDLKISRLLKDHPGSLNILLQSSPHFSKLQNKLLRKALAGRVTIEQAASIAGVDLKDLLSKLNKSSTIVVTDSNLTVVVPPVVKNKPEFLSSINKNKIITLDVRPILDSGKDPLQNILSKITDLKFDEVLLIINSFEPIPLYSLLAKKGFSYWTEKEKDVYRVFFYRTNNEINSDISPNLSSPEIIETDYEKIIDVDVHDLQPPEPMIRILENLTRINDNTLLRVYHHREPHLLYPRLDERGYYAVCTKLGEDNYKILIAKKEEV